MAATDKYILCLLLLGAVLLMPSLQLEEKILLTGAVTQCVGRVEIFHNGTFGTVCGDNWDMNDAEVVCRQLGCGPALKAITTSVFGKGEGPIWLNDVSCSGNESSLIQCGHSGFGNHKCGQGKDASVICSASFIRLAGSKSTRCSGRVEVFREAEWGTVCDDEWDMSDAEVVCREVGCGPAVLARTSATFGEGRGEIWLDDVQCSGNERSLIECGHRGIGKHNCGHKEDAGVVCQENVRLAGSGSSQCAGRVEVYHNGEWGTVCVSAIWDIRAAEVVCKQLGCGSAVAITRAEMFGQGSGKIWLDDVRCVPSVDKAITECLHNGFGVHECDHSQDFGVICA